MRASQFVICGTVGLCLAGCANQTYIQEEVAAATKAADNKVGEVQKQVEATQTDVAVLKNASASQSEQIAKLSSDLPAFPWPPPQPTSFTEIKRDLLLTDGATTTWGDVAGKLRVAADRAGYQGYTWFSVPNGFALVLHVEQFDSLGHAKDPRWITEPHCGRFSLSCITQALFTATPGSYRVIVFIVATGPVKVDLGTAMTIE
jgi:hypothetical protein